MAKVEIIVDDDTPEDNQDDVQLVPAPPVETSTPVVAPPQIWTPTPTKHTLSIFWMNGDREQKIGVTNLHVEHGIATFETVNGDGATEVSYMNLASMREFKSVEVTA